MAITLAWRRSTPTKPAWIKKIGKGYEGCVDEQVRDSTHNDSLRYLSAVLIVPAQPGKWQARPMACIPSDTAFDGYLKGASHRRGTSWVIGRGSAGKYP